MKEFPIAGNAQSDEQTLWSAAIKARLKGRAFWLFPIRSGSRLGVRPAQLSNQANISHEDVAAGYHSNWLTFMDHR